ncbi:hypothetical protein Tco_1134980 [Tanacetum coccineum]
MSISSLRPCMRDSATLLVWQFGHWNRKDAENGRITSKSALRKNYGVIGPYGLRCNIVTCEILLVKKLRRNVPQELHRMGVCTSIGDEDYFVLPVSLTQEWGLDAKAMILLPFLSKTGVPWLLVDPGGNFQDYIGMEVEESLVSNLLT